MYTNHVYVRRTEEVQFLLYCSIITLLCCDLFIAQCFLPSLSCLVLGECERHGGIGDAALKDPQCFVFIVC